MGISGRIARFFQDSQLTPLIALVAFLLGLFAVAVTPREEEPQINVTMANAFIPFPGASAKDGETLVATPAEQVLAQMTGAGAPTTSSALRMPSRWKSSGFPARARCRRSAGPGAPCGCCAASR
jgi:hypothetical protein